MFNVQCSMFNDTYMYSEKSEILASHCRVSAKACDTIEEELKYMSIQYQSETACDRRCKNE